MLWMKQDSEVHPLWQCHKPTERGGYVIVTGLSVSMREREGGFLAKRTTNSAGDSTPAKAKRTAKAVEREYVPLEDDPPAAGSAPEGSADATTTELKKPSMREVFGPGGFLEKCMQGGVEPSTVSPRYQDRPGQLEMAEMVQDAFESHH